MALHTIGLLTGRSIPTKFLFMNITETFRADVEAYIERTGITPTAFGHRVLGDKRFVWQLRDGRSPSAKTMDTVLEFIRENPQ